MHRSPSSLRASASRQAPLLIALIVLALVVVFARARKSKPEPSSSTNTAAATGGSPSTPAVPSEPEPLPPEEPPFPPLRVENSGLPCDVDDALAKKCRRCHATPARHGAPFPLYTWDDLQVLRGTLPLYQHVARVIETGYMPFRIPTNPPVEPLTDSEKKALLDWAAASAPRGACPPIPAKKKRSQGRPPRI